MNLLQDNIEINYHNVIAKSLYFGMFVNVLIPMGGLMICYYLEQNASVTNKTGDIADGLFYVFALLSLIHAAYALWQKGKTFQKPMIRREQTFEQDLAIGLSNASKPIFLMIASISLYGYVYFYLTGRFKETVFLVLLSFIIFQAVRPRVGMVRKLAQQQKVMMQRGELLK